MQSQDGLVDASLELKAGGEIRVSSPALHCTIMFQIFQVTAEYSNAVLVAIMPYVSDFAKNLELPLPQPVNTAQVEHFGCSPRSDHVGGHVVLTNGYEFSFDRGRVVMYRSPKSYFSLQDPDKIPSYYGDVKVTKQAAMQVARGALRKLGYSDAMVFTDRAPEITPPPHSGSHVVPRYRFKWHDPDLLPGMRPLVAVDVEVDADSNQIQMLNIMSKNTVRPDPPISVHPPVVGKGPETTYGGGRKIYLVSQAYSNALVVAILPQLADYVKRTGVAVKLPITRNDIDYPRCTCGLVDNSSVAYLYLKTGERFVYSHGQVVSFETHDAVRLPENADKPSAQFYGKNNMSEQEAVALVRKTVTQLGYSLKTLGFDAPPNVIQPRKQGTNTFARYFVRWRGSADHSLFLGVAEVEATNKKLKALYINDHANTNIWRDAPKIDVPPTPEISGAAAIPIK